MTVSGWFVALLVLGAVPVIAFDGLPGLFGWLAVVAVLTAIDLGIAGSPRGLRFSRTTPARVRLGETVDSSLLVTNAGRRRVRGVLRDAWQPSAGAGPTRQPVLLPPRERRAFRVTLTPVRRGERRAAHVTVRSYGPLRLAARQASIRVPGSIRVLPPFNSRKHLPSRLARLRELDGQTSVMVRGPGTEFDSLREYVRGDDVRSIDWR
ncbi:MAG: DUF58 domain-containing protein, partial [Pseudolysinimonas sp.]